MPYYCIKQHGIGDCDSCAKKTEDFPRRIVVKEISTKTIRLFFMVLSIAGFMAFLFFIIHSVFVGNVFDENSAFMGNLSFNLGRILMFFFTCAVPIVIFISARSIPVKHVLLSSAKLAVICLTSFTSFLCFVIAYILMYVELFDEPGYFGSGAAFIVIGAYCMHIAAKAFLLNPPLADTQENKE